ncbi:hypothetical protein [Embleya hyalina]|uniref:Uncharacterized protein n=1 Tax=Embleya hyalina TaxID=516124 RepID=A0A401Z403_9ACTN|nr:hypothetical protein [Embleya hyalina]GCE01582.1 hypothetical protein EHYA_09348 [Embleya hyalina]
MSNEFEVVRGGRAELQTWLADTDWRIAPLSADDGSVLLYLRDGRPGGSWTAAIPGQTLTLLDHGGLDVVPEIPSIAASLAQLLNGVAVSDSEHLAALARDLRARITHQP